MSPTSIHIGNPDRLRRAAFPPDLDLSFGEAAVARGYVTPERLEECRRHCERRRRRGEEVTIGSLLLKRGDLTVEQYLEILALRDAEASREPEGPPRSVLGKYRIVRELGRGGMGIVYEARDAALRRRVALKVLKPQDPPKGGALDRFQREATIGAKLRHPNIVGVHEFGAARDSMGHRVHYLAMDYVEGRTLARLMAEGKTPQVELLRILEDVGRAVAFAHRMGVIHRDLKPANVIVEATGRAVLADFGAAQAEDLETRLTTAGMVIGTPPYMAPEQARGETDRIDARTDVYALGAILYEILTGLPPFGEDSTARLLQNVLTVEPIPPSRRADGVDPRLERLALRSIAKDPAKRHPSAREWVAELLRCRRGAAAAPRRARRTLRWGLGLAALVAVIGLAVPTFSSSPAARPPEQQRRPGSAHYPRVLQTAQRLGQRVDDIAEGAWRDDGELRRELVHSDPRARELKRQLRQELDALDPASLAPAEATCVRGLRAWASGDASQARRLLKEAAPEEAGDAMATLDLEEGRVVESIRVPDLERGAFLRFLRAVETSKRGGPAEEDFAAAAAALKDERRALAHLAWAVHEMRRGREAGELFAESIRDLDEVVSAKRDATKARLWRGLARTLWGFSRTLPPWGGANGRDPGALVTAAIDDFDALLAGPEAPEMARTWRGAAFLLQGIVQTARLSDPRESYERALGDLGEAIRLNPSRDEPWMWRGIARKCWAIREFLGRRDPQPAYQAAMADLNEAIRRNPRRTESWTQRGEARLLWANFAMPSRGEDPLPLLEEAIRDLDESIRLNPSQGLVWSARGTARETCGRLQAARTDGVADAWYAAALGDYEEALRLSPALGVVLSKPLNTCVEALHPSSP